jgi:hypothetical protein
MVAFILVGVCLFAKVTLRGQTDRSSRVAVFDGSILATAAVSAPEAMAKSVGTALDCFGDPSDDECALLFETFRVWQENGRDRGGHRSRAD